MKMMGLAGLLILGTMSCTEKVPTSVDGALLPDKPVTIEIRLPWTDFGSDFAVHGGYGYAFQLQKGLLAHTYGGTLEARTLATFGTYNVEPLVRDSSGTLRTDTAPTIIGGRVVAHFDTLSSTVSGVVTVQVSAIQQEWDPKTASWDMAVDTTNNRTAWTQPGGGDLVPLTTADWSPPDGDSVVIEIDSATVASLGDTLSLTHGLAVSVLTGGVRLNLTSLDLSLVGTTKINPDTTLYMSSTLKHLTFIYSPPPGPPNGTIRVGGVPAWRSSFTVTLPKQLNGPSALCEAVGCPMTLRPDQVNYAAIILRTAQGDAAFRPVDSLGIDVREVLSPSELPKSPLSGSLIANPDGLRIPAFKFNQPQGEEIEIPVTGFVQDLVRGTTTSGRAVSNTLSLLAPSEPSSISFGTFDGPTQTWAPMLRLIVTAGNTVVLP